MGLGKVLRKIDKYRRSWVKDVAIPVTGAVGAGYGAALAPGAIGPVLGVAGDVVSAREANRRAREERAAQEEFARHGVQWRVEDARAAGIAPLAALGFQGMQYSPSSGSVSEVGEALSGMGQNISRAVAASQTKMQRMADMLKLRHMALENALLENHVANSRPGVGPSFPSVSGMGPGLLGQGDAVGAGSPGFPYVEEVPFRTNFSRNGVTMGSIPEIQYYRRTDGSLGIEMSPEFKQRTDDRFFSTLLWEMRNRLPFMMFPMSPSHSPREKDFPLPKDEYWKWNNRRQGFYPAKRTYRIVK